MFLKAEKKKFNSSIRKSQRLSTSMEIEVRLEYLLYVAVVAANRWVS